MSGNGSSIQAARKRVYFKLTAPEAGSVRLLGSFSNWDSEGRALKRTSKGVWTTWMLLAPGTYEYRFLVDGEWCNDPEAECVPNPYGTQNSRRVVA